MSITKNLLSDLTEDLVTGLDSGNGEDNWILATNFWDDTGVWEDNDFWND